MKKTELVLGAIVSVKGNEALRVKINGLTQKKIQYINENRQPEYLRYSQLVPIELNNNILFDLGFKIRRLVISGKNIFDYILILTNNKDDNDFYTIIIQPDDELNKNNRYRSIQIENSERKTVRFGYVKDIHELQAIIQTSIKLNIDTEKFLLCGKD
jgi:hypothetical protein